jgi:thiamine biosynthesis lipoprotein
LVSIPALTGAGAAYWSERFLHAMGSPAHIVSGDAPDGVVDWAVAELERLEQCWSRFRPDSELSRLNASGGAWTEVSASMLLALTCAADLHRATAGRFDPTIIDALERSGYDRTFEMVPPDADDADRIGRGSRNVPGFTHVEIDDERSRVRLPAGTRIDLGGLGKGLAADLVARGIVDRGARSALVALGGDVRARGEAVGPVEPVAGDGGGTVDGWDIPVVDPFDDDRIVFRFPLTDGAIVTSTTRMRRWTVGGRRYHHILDPVTGESTRTGIAAVVAAARDAWWAEGIAKAIIVGGVDDGVQLAADAYVRAWLFLDDGSTIEAGPAA